MATFLERAVISRFGFEGGIWVLIAGHFILVIVIFVKLDYILKKQNQSRTNGPINAHLTIAQVKNKRHSCKSFVKISAVAWQ